MYANNTPSLAPAADATGSASVSRAPAVVAGTPRRLVDMNAAAEETNARKRLRLNDPTQVSADEVAAARVREAHIALEFVPGGGGGGGLAAPPWLAPALAAFRVQIRQDIREEIRLSDLRTQARIYNSHVFNDDQHIEALEDSNGVVPMNFPATTADIKNLRSAPLNLLLNAYGQPTLGNIAIRKQRLGSFLGLASRF